MEQPWLEAQNSERAIVFRGASDALWSRVQTFRMIEFIAVVLAPLALSIITQFDSRIVAISGFVGFALLVADTTLFYPSISMMRRRAACAQQVFDSIAFGMNRLALTSFDCNETEIYEDFGGQKKSRASFNSDWYTSILGNLPIRLGRIACMRESVSWDEKLRVRYRNVLSGLLVFIALTLVAYWSKSSIQASDLIAGVLYPLAPAVAWIGREIWDQQEAIALSSALRNELVRAWNEAVDIPLDDGDLEVLAAILSAKVFAYRERTVPVPNTLYLLLRDRQADVSGKIAEAMVNQFRVAKLKQEETE